MPALPGTVSPPPPDPDSAEVLFSSDLPGGEQEGEPAALATQAGKPRYFCGAQHVNRVQAWREKSPKYRPESPLRGRPLQEMFIGQAVDGLEESATLALQEMIQPEVRESIDEIGLLGPGALQDPM
jgi:hypothetical protein